MLARKDRPGVRLFEACSASADSLAPAAAAASNLRFRRGRGYRHTWLTNGALEALPALDDRALLAGVDFSPL